ncbi:uncharacterized protein LOC116288573 [Actinia tenebrosa]|uniref:Uncharacterized protein LOC116288573 n=1 Tax=Actinia tenebrosa TaxID=6105 RepID=A0A6P8H6X6_ACTTE|nr:uncharacterized protein LOC116288573 [Actinia tenebrosa]
MAEEKVPVLAVLVCTLLSTFLPPVLSLSKCSMIDACKASTDKGNINLWPLIETGKPPRFSNIKEEKNKDNTYSWNPCNPWTENASSGTNECKDVAVCLLHVNSGETLYYGVGKANTTRFQLDGGTGDCSITYTGHFISLATQVQINLNCNEDEEGRIDEFIHSQDSEIIKATLHSKYACPLNKNLSTGSVLLIIFFSVLVIYLLGGMLFLKVTRGARGKELLPNYPFWSDLFMLMQEGCVFTVDKVKGLCGGRSTGYQSI